MTRIGSGTRVVCEYRILDSEGRVFEASEDEGPVDFVQGRGEVPPGLERALEGRAAGERLVVELEPEEAFGAHDPAGLVALPRHELPAELTRGDVLPLVLTDDEGGELEDGDLEVRVLEIRDDEVIVDANHPLAGQRVTFEIRILEVLPT